MMSGCFSLGSALKEREYESSSGKYRIVVCPVCGEQIKVPF